MGDSNTSPMPGAESARGPVRMEPEMLTAGLHSSEHGGATEAPLLEGSYL